MSRYRGPRLRIIRRLGEIPGLTNKTPKNQARPGQHGKATRKLSQYGIRLQEKQKMRFHYGITESQLVRYVRFARRLKGSTGEVLLQLLEMRLDNIVYRLGFAPTMSAARQLVRHGHIRVNGKKATIPSYQCRPKDVLTVSEKKGARALVTQNMETVGNNRVVPGYVTCDANALRGTVNQVIDRQSVGLSLNELLIVEYYSRKV
jgi:small subunit ribosomal protein S4|uniref:Small ribosomal subunit protein uS4c n=1 Tax=Medakamo hakoo TaxID=3113649 RepID=A0A8E4BY23_9CHLO|nr:ribosomal protein S4 [Medakamo hakoo]